MSTTLAVLVAGCAAVGSDGSPSTGVLPGASTPTPSLVSVAASLAGSLPPAVVSPLPAGGSSSTRPDPTATSTSTPSWSGDLATHLESLRLPYPLSRTVAFVDGTSVVIAGGLTPGGTVATILRLDPAAGTITPVGALAVAVHDAAGAALRGTWLVIGGGRVTQDSVVQTAIATGTGHAVGQLPSPRADLVAEVVGGTVVVLGGGAGGRADASVLSSSDGRTYRKIASLHVGVRYAAVAQLGGLIYLFGGASDTGDVSAIQVIDPSTGVARLAGKLPSSLAHASAFTLGGSIYIAGGRHGGNAVNTILRYDPTTDAVIPAGHLPESASDMAVAVIGGTVYLIGGEDKGPLSSLMVVERKPN